MSVTLLLLLLPAVSSSANTKIPVLTTDTKLASAGYYQLSWQPGLVGASDKNLHFELQQSRRKEFLSANTIYRGPDRASVISGQADGDYYYRVRTIYSGQSFSQWSNVILVKVQHHSLQKAWLFFTAGAFVFLLTLSFIVTSATRNARG